MIAPPLRAVPLALLAAAAPPAANPVAALAGRYYEQFPNGTVDGETYTGENIVEIVPVAPGAAYVRAELSFYNGHSCSIAGVANADGPVLVYREPTPDRNDATCALTVSRQGAALRLDDGDGGCQRHCGARGSLSRQELPFASRRPIRYLARLRASPEYRAALAEWRR